MSTPFENTRQIEQYNIQRAVRECARKLREAHQQGNNELYESYNNQYAALLHQQQEQKERMKREIN